MIDSDTLRERFVPRSPLRDERQRRLFAATEASAVGYRGIAAVSRATGIAARTIGRRLRELTEEPQLAPGRLRRAGGGRKSRGSQDRGLLADLLALVEPSERGDPVLPLWTCKSLRRLARELTALGHRISHTVGGEFLKQQRFSLQCAEFQVYAIARRAGVNMPGVPQLYDLAGDDPSSSLRGGHVAVPDVDGDDAGYCPSRTYCV